jgi:putative spermidine/putrescine transport system ATP-binding protein
MTPILQLNNVVFTYPGALEPAIKIEYLGLEQGKTLALIGSSGAGKTTVLRLVAGLQDLQTGSITLEGVELNGVAPDKRGIGLVFQNPMLFPFLNTIENVGFGLRTNKSLK